MPGPVKKVIKNEEKARKIIEERKEIFSVDVKGHIDPKFLNNAIRFSPIFMNVDIKTNKENIGETMFEYMKNNNMQTNRKERKLTHLTDTQQI
jgi:hypothetical protein